MHGHPIDLFLQAWARVSRTDGYDLRLRVYKVLGLDGRWDRDRLRVTLRSLLVHRVEDWDLFEREFDAFFPPSSASVEAIAPKLPAEKSPRPRGEIPSAAVRRRRTVAAVLTGVGLALIITLCILLLRSDHGHLEDQPDLAAEQGSAPLDIGSAGVARMDLTQSEPRDLAAAADFDGPTVNIHTTAHAAAETVPVLVTHRRAVPIGILAGAVLVFAALALWLWFALRQRRPAPASFAEELQYRTGQSPRPLSHRELDQLAYLTGLSLAADHLVLDESATVYQTARQAGMLMPVYRPSRHVGLLRVVMPDRVDAVSSALILTLVQGLRERGVPVDFVHGLPASAAEPGLALLIIDASQPTSEPGSPWLTEWLKLPHVAVVEARDPGLWGQEVERLPVGVFPPRFGGLWQALLSAASGPRPRPLSVPRRGAPARNAEALPLFAACAIASPCDLATADQLRREFTPHLSFSVLQRIIHAEGVTPDESGWRFSAELQARLVAQVGPTYTRRVQLWQERRLAAMTVRPGTRAAFMCERELALLRLQLAVGHSDRVVEAGELRVVLQALEPQMSDPRLVQRLRERVRGIVYGLPIFHVRERSLQRRLRRLGVRCEVVVSQPLWLRWAPMAAATTMALGGGLSYFLLKEELRPETPDLRQLEDLRAEMPDLVKTRDFRAPTIADLSQVETPDTFFDAARHQDRPDMSRHPSVPKPPDLGDHQKNHALDLGTRLGAEDAQPLLAPTVETSAPPSKTLERALKLYDSEDYALASIELNKVIETQTGDDAGNFQRAQFFMGKALFNLKLYSASLRYWSKIVDKGASHRYYAKTLQWLASLSRFLPESAGVLAKIAKYNRQDLEQPALEPVRNELYYLLGRYHYGQGNYKDAIELFALIPESNEFFARAKYIEGIIYVRDNDGKRAVAAFRQILLKAKESKDKATLSFESLGNLSIARVFYATRQWPLSIKYYSRIPKRSPDYPSALLESAWAHYQSDRLAEALAQLDTLSQLTGKINTSVSAESPILRAIIHFDKCEPKKARQALGEYKIAYALLSQELVGISDKHPDNVDFYKYIELIRSGKAGLSQRVQRAADEALQYRSLVKTIDYVTELDRELRTIGKVDPLWNAAPIGGFTVQDLTLQRTLAENEAGGLARRLLSSLASKLNALEKSAGGIEYELIRMEEASKGGPCKIPEPDFPPKQ